MGPRDEPERGRRKCSMSAQGCKRQTAVAIFHGCEPAVEPDRTTLLFLHSADEVAPTGHDCLSHLQLSPLAKLMGVWHTKGHRNVMPVTR